MYIKEITFTDFNGNTVTEIYCFNLNKVELMELQTSVPGGWAALGEKAVKEQDSSTLFKLYKELVLTAVGEKSADGKQFIKTPEIVSKFQNSNAFPEFMMALVENEKLAEEFIAGILPNGADALKSAKNQMSFPDPTKV